MQFSHIGLIGVLLSTVIGSAIPSVQDDDRSPSAPEIHARAPNGYYILTMTQERTTKTQDEHYQMVAEQLEIDFPKADVKLTKLKAVTGVKGLKAKLVVLDQFMVPVKNKIEDVYKRYVTHVQLVGITPKVT
jgi:hypothetical protein